MSILRLWTFPPPIEHLLTVLWACRRRLRGTVGEDDLWDVLNR